MSLSVFDLYSVGIGPSSSHTVGPMRAAKRFIDDLDADGRLPSTARVCTELFGSLAATGHGHGTVTAVILGLEGEDPARVETANATARAETAAADAKLVLGGRHPIGFIRETDLLLHFGTPLPMHPNGMRFTAYNDQGGPILSRVYYSVGGGFISEESEMSGGQVASSTPAALSEPYPFSSAVELLAICESRSMMVSEVMMANELTWRSSQEITDGLMHIWTVMAGCVEAGCQTEGVLPGGLRVRRRAPALLRSLESENLGDPLRAMEWVNLFALAVNEENAAGGRVVTAPTNGAAGIVPAVLHYYVKFVPGADDDGIVRFLLTAGAIGILFKKGASISGAEVGCQGEVGSACAMAAGALCEVLGGSPLQVEHAAEVGIEHNLGLTCDPVGGLVQIPCIERNAIASMKAINAARLARRGDGHHIVSLDAAIRTMRETGRDMDEKYKETARGGLAVNVVEC